MYFNFSYLNNAITGINVIVESTGLFLKNQKTKQNPYVKINIFHIKLSINSYGPGVLLWDYLKNMYGFLKSSITACRTFYRGIFSFWTTQDGNIHPKYFLVANATRCLLINQVTDTHIPSELIWRYKRSRSAQGEWRWMCEFTSEVMLPVPACFWTRAWSPGAKTRHALWWLTSQSGSQSAKKKILQLVNVKKKWPNVFNVRDSCDALSKQWTYFGVTSL